MGEMADTPDAITLSDDGFSMPTIEVLTGRGFVTGKSGSGKSNTVSVIAEELLAAEVPLLIVDTDGEYYGLKEDYELLHVGGDEHCDLQVTPAHAEQIAAVALDRQVPVILDVSGYRDPDEGRQLVGDVVEELFVREKQAKTPFLVIVEEAHEFVPEQGGLDDVGKTIIRVAKRGRKRGLGVCALSQRPASVAKDYITQCDWLVWHRLTWENDTKVVGRILGNDAADDVEDLDDGEAIVMTDWDDQVERFRFRRKHTFDAGATPDLNSVDRPDLKSVDGDLLAELQSAIGGGDDVSDDGAGTDQPETEDDADATDDEEGSAVAETQLVDEDDGPDPLDPDAPSAGEADGFDDEDDLADDLEEAAATESGDTEERETPTAATKSGRRRGGRAMPAPDGADPAADSAWEVAQFVTYLTGAFVTAIGRGVAAIGRAVSAVVRAFQATLRRIADGLTDTPRGQRRVEAILPKLLLVVVGVLAGAALVVLLG